MATYSARRSAHPVPFRKISVIDVARVLLGEESRERSTATEKRFPDHAGLFVNVEKIGWYCHGDSAGGDGLGLVKFVRGVRCQCRHCVAAVSRLSGLDRTTVVSISRAAQEARQRDNSKRSIPSYRDLRLAIRTEPMAILSVEGMNRRRFSQWRIVEGKRRCSLHRLACLRASRFDLGECGLERKRASRHAAGRPLQHHRRAEVRQEPADRSLRVIRQQHPEGVEAGLPSGRACLSQQQGQSRSPGNIVQRGLIPAVTAAGLTVDGKAKYSGMHLFRHFYASWCIDRGLPPKVIQERLGHSSITMTFDRYGHLFPRVDDSQEARAGRAWQS